MPGKEGVQVEAGTQLARMYIDQRQTTVAQWVALRLLFEVFVRETGYEEGGESRKEWWPQEATEKNLWYTL